jgi:hypothetical protein
MSGKARRAAKRFSKGPQVGPFSLPKRLWTGISPQHRMCDGSLPRQPEKPGALAPGATFAI